MMQQMHDAPPEQPAGTESVKLLRVWNKEGYWDGMTQRTLFVALRVGDQVSVEALGQSLSEVLRGQVKPPDVEGVDGGQPAEAAPQDAPTTVERLLLTLAFWAERIVDSAGFPPLGRPVVRPLGEDVAGQLPKTTPVLVMPVFDPRASAAAVIWVSKLVNLLLENPSMAQMPENVHQDLKKLMKTIGVSAPKGTNNRKFIAAAAALGIPFMVLPENAYQYGWGRRAQWMSTSFSESISNISVKLAKNKLATNLLLRQARLPVPNFAPVRDVDSALAVAKRLGFPLVIKPADRDGGVGVTVHVQSAAQVAGAFERARKHSANVMMQKQLSGTEYRLNVFQGKLVAALERLPAAVTGDGVSTLRQLIAVANQDARRGSQPWDHLKPIAVDEEAKELIEVQGLDLEAIPAKGRFVRLSNPSRASRGGIPRDVLAQVHPDNAWLAIQAAELLRLEIAGIDLLAKDIGRSWRNGDVAIMEVNSAPEFGRVTKALPEMILRRLVPAHGRIPVVLLVSGRVANADALVRGCSQQLAVKGLCVGTTTPTSFSVGDEFVTQRRRSMHFDARALLIRPSVDAVLICANGEELYNSGFPVDRFDTLAVLDTAAGAQSPTTLTPAQWLELVEQFGRHCTGRVLLAAGLTFSDLFVRIFGRNRVGGFSAATELTQTLVQGVLQHIGQKAEPLD